LFTFKKYSSVLIFFQVTELNEENIDPLGTVCSFSDVAIAKSFLPYFLSINPSTHIIVCGSHFGPPPSSPSSSLSLLPLPPPFPPPLPLSPLPPLLPPQCDPLKHSALHIAAYYNADATIKVLLREEPSLINYKNANKQTAYAYMVRGGGRRKGEGRREGGRREAGGREEGEAG
jgi:hypothetical protein